MCENADDFYLLFISYDSNGARPAGHRTMSDKRQEIKKKSLNKSADARPGTGRCPSGHRCFMSQTATGKKRRVFAEEHIAFTYNVDISLLKTKIHKYKNIYFAWAAEDY